MNRNVMWTPIASAGGGADVIYAGKGKDHTWDRVGNDVVFGGERVGIRESLRWRPGGQLVRVANKAEWRASA